MPHSEACVQHISHPACSASLFLSRLSLEVILPRVALEASSRCHSPTLFLSSTFNSTQNFHCSRFLYWIILVTLNVARLLLLVESSQGQTIFLPSDCTVFANQVCVSFTQERGLLYLSSEAVCRALVRNWRLAIGCSDIHPPYYPKVNTGH